MTLKILVMGVSGSGKSQVGKLLANKLNLTFFDGDDYHSAGNVEKMRQGIPLADKDREGWLNTLNQLIHNKEQLVLACSALKPDYREILRRNNDELQFIYLKGDIETIWDRHQSRKGHYFQGRSMLENQFETLTEPDSNEALHIDIKPTIDNVVRQIVTKLNQAELR